jgi:hypothetical protein
MGCGRLRRRWSVGAEDPWGVPDADPKEEIKEREGKEERALAGRSGWGTASVMRGGRTGDGIKHSPPPPPDSDSLVAWQHAPFWTALSRSASLPLTSTSTPFVSYALSISFCLGCLRGIYTPGEHFAELLREGPERPDEGRLLAIVATKMW